MTRLDKDGPSACMAIAWISKPSLMALVCDVRNGQYCLDEFSEYDASMFDHAAAAIRRHIRADTSKGLPAIDVIDD